MDCRLFERECIDCGECDVCDLDVDKICDNCMRCLETDADYSGVLVNEIVMPEDDSGNF
jgi:hypothetical protein